METITEGCNHRVWRVQLNDWEPTGFEVEELFASIFYRDIIDPGLTILQALDLYSCNYLHQLARESITAILNTSHPNVNYPIPMEQIIYYFQFAYDSNDSSIIKKQFNLLELYNNQFCPIKKN
ncbi:hypothetical protein [Natranaerobius trueperi]|uniref:Uncharacterized protein n=1 Tax=Natranaerobius trueperi TaxID=759412 RepID=A0A226BXB3_9FIRM|nr:hypothetical protein [Natranaerobius trueperi]OWZ82747.1 hypothetical protein CDO51_12395 [Natranaerobius trueperi]